MSGVLNKEGIRRITTFLQKKNAERANYKSSTEFTYTQKEKRENTAKLIETSKGLITFFINEICHRLEALPALRNEQILPLVMESAGAGYAAWQQSLSPAEKLKLHLESEDLNKRGMDGMLARELPAILTDIIHTFDLLTEVPDLRQR